MFLKTGPLSPLKALPCGWDERREAQRATLCEPAPGMPVSASLSKAAVCSEPGSLPETHRHRTKVEPSRSGKEKPVHSCFLLRSFPAMELPGLLASEVWTQTSTAKVPSELPFLRAPQPSLQALPYGGERALPRGPYHPGWGIGRGFPQHRREGHRHLISWEKSHGHIAS